MNSMKQKHSINEIKIILTILMLFLLFETVVHWFGLPILAHEHLYDTPYTIYLGRLVGMLTLIWAGFIYLIIKDMKKYKEALFVTIFGLFLTPIIETWINFSADLSGIIASGPYGMGISLQTGLWRESIIAGIFGILLLYFYYKNPNK
jgi:FtsH-binding integral membrane protein